MNKVMRLFCLAAAVVMLICTTGIGMAEEKPSQLTALIWGSASTKASYDAAIEKYWTPLHPDVPVEVILVPSGDYSQKLLTMIATETAPDIIWVSDSYFYFWTGNGYLMDLSELMTDEEYDYEDFIESQRTIYQIDGVPYSVPFSSPPQVILYNKTLFENAGLETPNELYEKGEWTADKMFEYAVALADQENGVYGINFTRTANWTGWGTFLYPVIKAYGGDFWSDDFSTVLINSEEAIKGLEKWGELMFTHKAHPQPGDSADFFAGKSAMYVTLFGDVKKCKDLGFEWDMAPMPFAPDGSYSATLGTASAGVYAHTKYPEWSLELLKVLTGKGVIGELQNTFISPRASVLNSEEFITGNNGEIPRPTEEHYKQAVTDHTSYVRTQRLHPNIDKIGEVIMTHIEAFFMQMETAEECIQAIADEIEEFMIK